MSTKFDELFHDFFLIVKFGFCVYIKAASSVRNCHEVNQSLTLPARALIANGI